MKLSAYIILNLLIEFTKVTAGAGPSNAVNEEGATTSRNNQAMLPTTAIGLTSTRVKLNGPQLLAKLIKRTPSKKTTSVQNSVADKPKINESNVSIDESERSMGISETVKEESTETPLASPTESIFETVIADTEIIEDIEESKTQEESSKAILERVGHSMMEKRFLEKNPSGMLHKLILKLITLRNWIFLFEINRQTLEISRKRNSMNEKNSKFVSWSKNKLMSSKGMIYLYLDFLIQFLINTLEWMFGYKEMKIEGKSSTN